MSHLVALILALSRAQRAKVARHLALTLGIALFPLTLPRGPLLTAAGLVATTLALALVLLPPAPSHVRIVQILVTSRRCHLLALGVSRRKSSLKTLPS